jgi:hypothetical protein
MTLPVLNKLTTAELLSTHSAVLDELRKRNVIRSNNNPTGDYAEWLVSTKLKLSLANTSAKGFDAIDGDIRYQIKGRRVTPKNKSTQLSVIRNLEGEDFDFLVAVVFDNEWNVLRAAKISHQTVSAIATYRPHVNGHVMYLRPSIFENDGVEDILHLLCDG